MGVEPVRDPFFLQTAASELLGGLGDVLEIFLRCAARPPATQVGLLMVVPELLAETDHAQVVFDDSLPRRGVLKVCVAASRAAGDGSELHTDLIDSLPQTGHVIRIELS